FNPIPLPQSPRRVPSPKAASPKVASPASPTSPKVASPKPTSPKRSPPIHSVRPRVITTNPLFRPDIDDDEIIEEEERRYSSYSQSKQRRIRLLYENKFSILKNRFKDTEYPKLDFEKDSIAIIVRTYDDCVREIKVKHRANEYKQYFVFGLMILEIGLCYFGLNASGMTSFMLKLQGQFDEILTELGEQSGYSFGDGWSPMTKLIVTVVFITAIYVFVSWALAKLNLQNNVDTVASGIVNFIRGPNFDPTAENEDEYQQFGGLASLFGNFIRGRKMGAPASDGPAPAARMRPKYTQ
ncbi:MAG: hypothetical protein AAB966_03060, partial [Patescibacteria group bacterium]